MSEQRQAPPLADLADGTWHDFAVESKHKTGNKVGQFFRRTASSKQRDENSPKLCVLVQFVQETEQHADSEEGENERGI